MGVNIGFHVHVPSRNFNQRIFYLIVVYIWMHRLMRLLRQCPPWSSKTTFWLAENDIFITDPVIHPHNKTQLTSRPFRAFERYIQNIESSNFRQVQQKKGGNSSQLCFFLYSSSVFCWHFSHFIQLVALPSLVGLKIVSDKFWNFAQGFQTFLRVEMPSLFSPCSMIILIAPSTFPKICKRMNEIRIPVSIAILLHLELFKGRGWKVWNSPQPAIEKSSTSITVKSLKRTIFD